MRASRFWAIGYPPAPRAEQRPAAASSFAMPVPLKSG
jgi:hypothetical protein